jgi:hypothetical protein
MEMALDIKSMKKIAREHFANISPDKFEANYKVAGCHLSDQIKVSLFDNELITIDDDSCLYSYDQIIYVASDVNWNLAPIENYGDLSFKYNHQSMEYKLAA